MPKVFLTGATGYIGGHTLQFIANKHPEWDIIALVRNESQVNNARKIFPSIRTVVGSLEDLDLVGRLAAEMDVVLHLASSPCLLTSINIISSMARSKKAPGTFVQLSSLGTLQIAPNGYGNSSPIVYKDDDYRIPLASQIPPHSPEHAVLTAGRRHGVTTAIVCPSLIYGVGKGPVRTRGTTVPMLIEAILKRGRGFVVGKGKNEMSCIHINDVASALLTLTEHALAHQNQQTSSPTTTTITIDPIKPPLANAYLLTSPSPPVSMLSLTHSILTTLSIFQHSQFLSPTTENNPEINHLPTSHSTQIHPWAPLLWGSNLVGRSDLLHALGWRAHGPSLLCALSEMVDFEIELLAARDEDVLSAWRTDVEVRRPVEEEIMRCF